MRSVLRRCAKHSSREARHVRAEWPAEHRAARRAVERRIDIAGRLGIRHRVHFIDGGNHPDRVVALDLISILVAGTIAIYAIASGQAVFLDVATILALIGFLGTVAFARYIEKQASNE